MHLNKFALTMTLLSFILTQANCAEAQEKIADTEEVSAVQVAAKKNPGDLPYKAFYRIQKRLIDYLPKEPRVLDYMNRLSFTDVSETDADEFVPKSWGVSIVGDTVNEVLPMVRGGYFSLPLSSEAIRENARVMFQSQTKKNIIGVAWLVRHANHSLSYQAFAQALAEIKSVQEKFGWLETKLYFWQEKAAVYDSLKVCFAGAERQVWIADKLLTSDDQHRCTKLKFDQNLVAQNPLIRFVGEVEMVMLAESK